MDSSAEQIARYHIGLGWPGCGYHFVVRWDGTIEQANDLAYMSYNVASRNREVAGICLPGDYTHKIPRQLQLEAAIKLVKWLLKASLPGRKVVGHRDIALPGHETECPGNQWPIWRKLFAPYYI